VSAFVSACDSPTYVRVQELVNRDAGSPADVNSPDARATGVPATDASTTDASATDRSTTDASATDASATDASTTNLAPPDALADGPDPVSQDANPNPSTDAQPDTSPIPKQDAGQNAGTDAASDGSGATGPTDAAGNHCSVSGGAKIMLTVQNTFTNQTVSVRWVNLSCAEVEYSKLAPGGTYKVSTFASQYWRARDPAGALIKEIAVTPSPATQQVSVP
jgi:hypothetical protein